MDTAILSLIGIMISVGIYIYLIFRGFNVYILSLVAAVLVALFSGMDVVKLLTGPYMGGFVGFAKSFFLIFITSAIFGRLVSDAGVAYSISHAIANVAKRSTKHKVLLACLTLPAINAILTYSGISLFVAVFTLMVIGRNLFKELDIPWHLYGFGVLGSATFTMGMLPGSPAIQNLLPIKYFATTPMAAPLLGVVMAIMQIALSLIYCKYAVDKAMKNNERYLDTGKGIEEYFASAGTPAERDVHPLWKCFIPLAVPFIVMNGLKQDPVVALAAAGIVTYLMFYKEFTDVKRSLNEGAISAIMPMISVCSAVGFGGAVGAAPGFKMITSALTSLPGPGTFHLVLAIGVASMITGSSSAGATIALDALASKYAPLVDSAVAHRLTAAAGFGGLAPHSGGVFSTVTIIRIKHSEIYRHYFMIGLLIPAIVVFTAVFLAQLGIK